MRTNLVDEGSRRFILVQLPEKCDNGSVGAELGYNNLCEIGDTNTVEGLTEFAQDADLLLADGLFPTEMWQTGLPHLSAAQTAELARDARVKKLVITHLNPNIDPETLLKQARAIRTDAELAHIGATYRV